MAPEQSTTFPSDSTAPSANMTATRNDEEVEMSTFDEDMSLNGGQQELAKKKTHVLLASALLQLPIWGRFLFPPL